MSSKKLINNPIDCVDQALEGLVMTHSGLRILGDQRVIVQDTVYFNWLTIIKFKRLNSFVFRLRLVMEKLPLLLEVGPVTNPLPQVRN